MHKLSVPILRVDILHDYKAVDLCRYQCRPCLGCVNGFTLTEQHFVSNENSLFRTWNDQQKRIDFAAAGLVYVFVFLKIEKGVVDNLLTLGLALSVVYRHCLIAQPIVNGALASHAYHTPHPL